jgi:LTXXQ motif family protein
MKNASRWLVVSVVILSAAALATVALARGGGGRGGGRGIGGGGNLCLSSTLLDISLSRIDLMVKPSGGQKAALDEFKKAGKDYSDAMSRACAGDSPTDVPAKLAASEKRLDVALAGVRKLKPLAEKFYATLNDEQKGEANLFVDLPGL